MAKILVVDDDEMFRDLYECILEKEGHDVVLAENGQMGFDAALAESPDLIIMDLNMPVMTGFEAMRRIRAEESIKKIPILAATAEDAAANYDEIYEAGGDGYLSKFGDTNKFMARINDLLP